MNGLADSPEPPSFELRLLGGLSLLGPSGPLSGRAAHRHPLALLALLATARGHAVGQEILMAYLWPERSARRARQLLNVAVYEIRQAVGKDALEREGGDVRLDVARVLPDVVAFSAAIAAADWEEAVARYGGPFLDGFHLPESRGFEDWLTVRREEYAAAHRAALEALADGAEKRGDLRAAEGWWRRRLVEEPSNGRVVVRLMEALERAGARGRALDVAEEHVRVMREDFGAEPDPAVGALVAGLREAAEPSEQPLAPRPPPADRTTPPTWPGPPSAAPEPPVPVPLPAHASVRHRVRPWVAAAAAVPLLAVVALVSGGHLWNGGPPEAAPGPDRIAVLPFAVSGEPRLAYLGEGVVDLLSTKLHLPGQLDAVDPRALLAASARLGDGVPGPEQGRAVARRFGATHFLTGRIVQAGEELSIAATLYEAGGNRRASAEVAVAGEGNILDGVDRLARELLASRYEGPQGEFRRTAALTTSSLPALRSFLAGERAFRAGRFGEAAEAFGRAALEDSTFALAHYRHSLAAVWADHAYTFPIDADARALRHRDRLSPPDRLLVEAYAGWRAGRADSAELLTGHLLTARPEHVEAWHQLGEILFHYNPTRGRSLTEAREPFEQALRYDPTHWGAQWHLALLAGSESRTLEAERRLRRLLEANPAEGMALEIRALLASVRGDRVAFRQLLPELARRNEAFLSSVAWRLAVHARDLEAAAVVGHLLVDRSRLERPRPVGHQILATLEATRGRWRVAAEHLRALRRLEPDHLTTVETGAVLSLVPLRPEGVVAPSPARRARAGPPVSSGELGPRDRLESFAAYLGGLLDAVAGDTAAVRATAAWLDAGPESERGLAAVLRAEIARRDGRPQEALALLERADVPVWFGWAASVPSNSRGHERWMRAELLRETGREEEALAWYASFGTFTLFDLPYLGPSHLRRAQILEARGERERAAEHYGRVAELWREADPELRPLVQEAERALARLVGS